MPMYTDTNYRTEMDQARLKEFAVRLEQRDCKREIGRLLEKYQGAYDVSVARAVALMHQHIDDHVQHQHDMRHMR